MVLEKIKFVLGIVITILPQGCKACFQWSVWAFGALKNPVFIGLSLPLLERLETLVKAEGYNLTYAGC